MKLGEPLVLNDAAADLDDSGDRDVESDGDCEGLDVNEGWLLELTYGLPEVDTEADELFIEDDESDELAELETE